MKLLALICLFSLSLFAQEKETPKPDPEQAELNRALQEAGPSGIDFIRALETHLKKYPESKQKVAIERAIVTSDKNLRTESKVFELH